MPTQDEIVAFSRAVRRNADEKRISLWESLTDYTERMQLEHAVVALLLSRTLKVDIATEVQDLNLLKRQGRKNIKLPV